MYRFLWATPATFVSANKRERRCSMVQSGRKISLAASLLGVALWALASPALADNPAFQIQFLEDNVLIRTVIDNNVLSGDVAPSAGVISFSGTVGDFAISTSVALENGHTAGSPPSPPNIPPPPAILQIGNDVITN